MINNIVCNQQQPHKSTMHHIKHSINAYQSRAVKSQWRTTHYTIPFYGCIWFFKMGFLFTLQYFTQYFGIVNVDLIFRVVSQNQAHEARSTRSILKYNIKPYFLPIHFNRNLIQQHHSNIYAILLHYTHPFLLFYLQYIKGHWN